ncbi:ABC transporter F family member 4 [Cardamine amara subsp. amara]|uniref:ABC transporter F family member 4 n=1 Tax=Cardamine amara subsp. amara TaxID=228776 RepID=A0ABD1BGK9_CARAN
MGKKNSEKGKPSGKDSKKEKISVLAMFQKEDKPKKSSSSRSKDAPKAPTSYIDCINLPSSGEKDEDEDVSDEKQRQMDARRKQKSEQRQLDISVTDKEQKKREKKERLAFEKAVIAKTETLKEDYDAYTVVIGSKTSVLEGEDKANANAKYVKIDSFSVSCRGKELLKNVSVNISHGKRYGLFGPNGMGKSTLLKLLAWRKIPVPNNIDILLVKQEVEADEKSALEAVLSVNEGLFQLLKEKETLEKDHEDAGDKLGEVYKRLNILEADAAKAHASKILAGLGFTEDMQKNTTESFSGGWRMRISLARALFMQPTLLLLDEPTNHLDLRADLWLTEYLCRWKKMLVVVSHYEDFLNTVCTDIIHLHDKKLGFYRGNFRDFKSGYELRRNEANKKFEIQEKQKKAAQRSGNQAQQKKLKEKAKAQKAPIRKKWRDYSVVLHFPIPTELSPPLLKLVDVSFSYPNKPDFKVSNVNVDIDMRTRVAIVGPNGGGKSTLLNLLAGDLVPTKGEVRRSQKLRIGRYSQHFVDLLTMEETPVQYLLRLYPDQEGLSKQEAVRAKLGKFGLLSDNHLTPISDLSGGQKARVVFTSISMSKPHILLLDEPTNHLDMETMDALADALDEFTGGVVLVSHDSRLISRVCAEEKKSQILVVEEGKVNFYEGTFEEYREDLRREIRAELDE